MPEHVRPVALRPLNEADADIIARWGASPDFCSAAGWSVRPLEERRAGLLDLIASPPAGCLRLGAATPYELVGYVDLAGTSDTRRELGYVVGPRERWGKGLGLAVAIAGIQYGFATLGLSTIWADVAEANVASVRICQRLGMREVEAGDPTTHGGTPTFYRRFTLDRHE